MWGGACGGPGPLAPPGTLDGVAPATLIPVERRRLPLEYEELYRRGVAVAEERARRTVREEVACMEAALKQDLAGGDDEDAHLVGTWAYRSSSKYDISRSPGGRLHFAEVHSTGREAHAVLRWEGPWLLGDVAFDDGEPLGSIRLRLSDEEHSDCDGSPFIMVSELRDAGSTEWVGHALARKVVAPSDAAEKACGAWYEHVTLEGEVLQETVLAEELRASEEGYRAHIAELRRRLATNRRPAARAKLKAAQVPVLQEEARQSADAARASLADEGRLHEQCIALEHQLRDLEVGQQEAAAYQEMQAVELSELALAERVRRDRAAVAVAREGVEQLRGRVEELSSTGGSLWDAGAGPGGADADEAEVADIQAALAAGLPAGHPALQADSLDTMLAEMEEERPRLRAAAGGLPPSQARRGGAEGGAESGGAGEALRALEEGAEELAGQVREAEAHGRLEAERLAAASDHAMTLRGELADIDDRLLEAATLRRENEILRRQQVEWERTQGRMLRLAEDLHRQRLRGANSQALVAARLVELQRELPLRDLQPATGGEAEKSLRQLLWENSELEERIGRLESDKVGLLEKRQGIVAYLRARAAPPPTAAAAAAATAPPPPPPAQPPAPAARPVPPLLAATAPPAAPLGEAVEPAHAPCTAGIFGGSYAYPPSPGGGIAGKPPPGASAYPSSP